MWQCHKSESGTVTLTSLECRAFQTFLLSNYFITKALVNVRLFYERTGFMTKERIEKELSKVQTQLEALQAKQKDLEEQKRMAERAEKMDIIEKNKISSEKLQLLIKLSEDEILQLLAEKDKKKEMTGNEEKVIS